MPTGRRSSRDAPPLDSSQHAAPHGAVTVTGGTSKLARHGVMGRLAAAALLAGAGCSIDDRSVRVAPTAVGESPEETPIDEGCQGMPLERALIADFSDASEVITFEGAAGVEFAPGPLGLGGVSYLFAARGQNPPALTLEPVDDDLALRIEADPGVPNTEYDQWSGFALGFNSVGDACLDATGYRGVRFTLEGDVGTCQVMFQVMMSQNSRIDEGFEHASCSLREFCYPPFSAPLVVGKKRVIELPFTALSDGSPLPLVDVDSITDVGLKFYAPFMGEPCRASLLLDDVEFYR